LIVVRLLDAAGYIFNYNKEHGRGFVEAWDRFEIHTPGIVSCAKSEERELQRVDGLTNIIIYSVIWHSVALDCYIDEDGLTPCPVDGVQSLEYLAI
jgi:hypothetical protein